MVIVSLKGEAPNSRAGIITGRSIGNAVKRNKARRRLRVIMQQFLPLVKTPTDLVIIGRTGMNEASFQEINIVVQRLLIHAGLMD